MHRMFSRHERHHFEEMLAMGRLHGGRGFGHFGGGFLGGGPGGSGFRTGRKLASGDLQLLLLALLNDKASHGYELIKTLEERSGGFYVPSPGMIYPALTYLEELGHATVVPEGTKKRYCITDQGRAHLQEHRAVVDAILEQLKQFGSRMDRVREAFAGDDEDDGGRHSHHGAELWLARNELKRALREKKHAGKAELQRIAAILKRAAAEILGQ